jgi:ubiquinone/menaquinone biosynthesis C-methylase UbiE
MTIRSFINVHFPHILFTFNPFKVYEYQTMIENIPIAKTDTILDLGCGYGLQTRLLAKKCRSIIGIDPNTNSIAISQSKTPVSQNSKIQFLAEPLEECNFRSAFFDRIFSFCVIEHIANWTAVLTECYRILKVSGSFVISVDSLPSVFDAEYCGWHSVKYHVKKYFEIEELRTILTEIGFSDVEVYPIFCSNIAKRLFKQIEQRNSSKSITKTILHFNRLKRSENSQSNQNCGIFLIAKCTK